VADKIPVVTVSSKTERVPVLASGAAFLGDSEVSSIVTLRVPSETYFDTKLPTPPVILPKSNIRFSIPSVFRSDNMGISIIAFPDMSNITVPVIFVPISSGETPLIEYEVGYSPIDVSSPVL
jgi:hypothetical protein